MDIDLNQLTAANDNDADALPLGDRQPAPVPPPACDAKAKGASPAGRSQPARSPTGDGPSAAQAPPVISLKDERIARDLRMQQLDELLDDSIKLARERQVMAAMASDDPTLEALYLTHYDKAASMFTKLLTTSHKHDAFLRGDD